MDAFSAIFNINSQHSVFAFSNQCEELKSSFFCYDRSQTHSFGIFDFVLPVVIPPHFPQFTHDVWFGCIALFLLVCLHFKTLFSITDEIWIEWAIILSTHLIGQLFIFAYFFANFQIHQNDSIKSNANTKWSSRRSNSRRGRDFLMVFSPSMRINVLVLILIDLSWKEIILCENNEIF